MDLPESCNWDEEIAQEDRRVGAILELFELVGEELTTDQFDGLIALIIIELGWTGEDAKFYADRARVRYAKSL